MTSEKIKEAFEKVVIYRERSRFLLTNVKFKVLKNNKGFWSHILYGKPVKITIEYWDGKKQEPKR